MNKFITYFIATVWVVNGLFAKVLNLVPRHQEIVGRILNDEHARTLTLCIGVLEILMALWIISRFKYKLCGIVQITTITTMNTIEFFYAKDLLLWGKFNAFFALVFMILIYYNTFHLSNQK